MRTTDQLLLCLQHSGATASLNVNAACAVVLHHFAQWAQLPEAPKQGYKYDVDTRHLQSVRHSGVPNPNPFPNPDPNSNPNPNPNLNSSPNPNPNPNPNQVPHSGVGLKQMRSLRADGTPAPRAAKGGGGEGGEGGEGEAYGGGIAGDLEALAGLDGEGGEDGGDLEGLDE